VIPSETRLSRADNVHAAVEPGPVRSLEENQEPNDDSRSTP
jgi:hypothetical protein